MFNEKDNGTAIAVSLLHSENGHNDFFIYLIKGIIHQKIEQIGRCSTIISSLNDSEELTMSILDTKILEKYQGKMTDGIYIGERYGQTLVDEVFRHAKTVGVKKIYGKRSGFDTSDKDDSDRWYAFWIKHYGCTASKTGFYKEL